uniref:BUD13 homolog n=1 Tax=Mesocestoides corti TaxID=53468 RepID=A0A5K3F3W7_MESCO
MNKHVRWSRFADEISFAISKNTPRRAVSTDDDDEYFSDEDRNLAQPPRSTHYADRQNSQVAQKSSKRYSLKSDLHTSEDGMKPNDNAFDKVCRDENGTKNLYRYRLPERRRARPDRVHSREKQSLVARCSTSPSLKHRSPEPPDPSWTASRRQSNSRDRLLLPPRDYAGAEERWQHGRRATSPKPRVPRSDFEMPPQQKEALGRENRRRSLEQCPPQRKAPAKTKKTRRVRIRYTNRSRDHSELPLERPEASGRSQTKWRFRESPITTPPMEQPRQSKQKPSKQAHSSPDEDQRRRRQSFQGEFYPRLNRSSVAKRDNDFRRQRSPESTVDSTSTDDDTLDLVMNSPRQEYLVNKEAYPRRFGLHSRGRVAESLQPNPGVVATRHFTDEGQVATTTTKRALK